MTLRNRTSSLYLGSALYFYYSGLFLTKTTAERLSSCFIIKRNYVSIWKGGIQKYKARKVSSNRKKIDEFVIDKTLIKAGSSERIWLGWVAIEPESKGLLGFGISKERNMIIIAERFVSKLVNIYGPHPIVSTDEAFGILNLVDF